MSRRAARVADPQDRRGILVELTPTGQALVDEIAEEHLQNERALIGSLTLEEQQTLAKPISLAGHRDSSTVERAG